MIYLQQLNGLSNELMEESYLFSSCLLRERTGFKMTDTTRAGTAA